MASFRGVRQLLERLMAREEGAPRPAPEASRHERAKAGKAGRAGDRTCSPIKRAHKRPRRLTVRLTVRSAHQAVRQLPDGFEGHHGHRARRWGSPSLSVAHGLLPNLREKVGQ
jgi:hypothetical protein